MTADALWIALGVFGQALFFSRFLVQWIATERQRQVTIPTAFWLFSMGGGLVLLSYAIHRRDLVFILGQTAGVVIYSRNLWFVFLGKRGQ